jgi:hypothetical protein|tara:strand:+ start:226 stop:492 length:267 start_codon:yes stop_codon:yes gene_type:complete
VDVSAVVAPQLVLFTARNYRRRLFRRPVFFGGEREENFNLAFIAAARVIVVVVVVVVLTRFVARAREGGASFSTRKKGKESLREQHES